MRYFLDTEFNERPGALDLISLAIVAEDGRELYVVSSEFNPAKCNDWVRTNVLPNLQAVDRVGMILTRGAIRAEAWLFVGDDRPEFWGYYADYDWVAFCWLFGAMTDLPKGWPMYCRDLKQWSDQIGAPKFEAPKGEHNALADARWNRDLYQHLAAWTAKA